MSQGDQGFKTQERCFFRPVSNDMSISLNTSGLEKFLKLIGREPAYVDLEANPPVGKDQSPDLAALVPSDMSILLDLPEKPAPLQNHVPKNNNSSTVAAKAVEQPNGSKEEKSTIAANSSSSFSDPEKFVEEILEKVSAIVLSETKEEKIAQHGEQLGTVVSNSIKNHLSLELKNLATMFKNTAYTQGFVAGKDALLSLLDPRRRL